MIFIGFMLLIIAICQIFSVIYILNPAEVKASIMMFKNGFKKKK